MIDEQAATWDAVEAIMKLKDVVRSDMIVCQNEMDEINDRMVDLHDRLAALTEAERQLRTLLPVEFEVVPAEELPGGRPSSTIEAVKRLLHENQHKSWTVAELLAEMQRRGWLDPSLKTPGPTIYQAAVRAAQRLDGVARTGKRFIALPSTEAAKPTFNQKVAHLAGQTALMIGTGAVRRP